MGVLQRIALCYFFASLIIYFAKQKAAAIISIALLLGYWLLCYFAGAPGDPYSINGWFGTQVDKNILGETHMYHGEGIAFDPEGFASLSAPIVQVIFGYFVGRYIQLKGKSYEMLSHLLIAGCIMVFAGICWNEFFPLNKKIWTSSYTVYTTGLALMVLSVAIFFIEFKNKKGVLAKFFDAFGKNPLFVFVLSGFLPRLLGLLRIPDGITPDGKNKYIAPFGWIYEHICKPVFSNENNSSLLYAICMITFFWLIAYWLDKKKIYVKV
jgi:predicted acyltransferase